MDWMKLFTLLLAVASISVKADGPKKKIRIHLPQKVKHIHHHKKIYITNHPAPQYAPAYLPSAEGTVAVPTSVALPAMANILPLNPVDLYDENPSRLPTIAPAASQILPLYHARGYYGPTPSDIEDTEDEESENVDFGSQSYPAHPPPHQSKRLKIIKVNEPPRKKVVRKVKPKRVVLRNKPLPAPNADGEHPVSTFHEQFYSDIDGSGTIRKIRKPPRVEKIVDGDTEHIHTYSEEHIHKMLYDSKLNGVVGIDPYNGLPVISNNQHVIPIKGAHQLLAVASSPFAGLAAVGAINNPAHFQYAEYNPREVTHDHIFHDHGEIPADVELNKEALALPPKVSYNSQGLRIPASNRPKSKNYHKSRKNLKPLTGDFSYYESIYSPSIGQSKVHRPSLTIPTFDASEEANYEEYKAGPEYGYKDKKPRNAGNSYYSKNDYKIQPSSPPAPFSTSSTVVHNYKPKRYSGPSPPHAGLTKLRDPFANFKDSYANNFEYDTYASSSNMYTSEDKNDVEYSSRGKNGKKKSISTQNISFGGKDHVSFVDHMEDESFIDSMDGDGPTALENIEQYDQQQNNDIVTQPTFMLKENTPSHQYYSLMAAKALHGDQMSAPDASNDNFQYADAPSVSTTGPPPVPSTPNYYNLQSSENPNVDFSKFSADIKLNKISESGNRHSLKDSQIRTSRTRLLQNQESTHSHAQDSLLVKGKLKYGDKI